MWISRDVMSRYCFAVGFINKVKAADWSDVLINRHQLMSCLLYGHGWPRTHTGAASGYGTRVYGQTGQIPCSA